MKPLVLSLDTSTLHLSAAICRRIEGGLEVLAVRTSAPPEITSTRVPLVLEELLVEAGATLGDVGVLAVDLGPGLFTGTRIAVATMKAVAYARSIPVVGARSLEAMALAAARGRTAGKGDRIVASDQVDPSTFCAMLDARKGEVYAATYRFETTRPIELSAPATGLAADVVAALRGPVSILGTGAFVPGVVLSDGITRQDVPMTPGAAEIAFLALQETPDPVFDLPAILALEPFYLRPPEAQVALEKRLKG